MLVDVHVRYPDVARSAARRYANGRHRVRSRVQLIGAGGAVIAADLDRGTGQVSIPSLRSYLHVHRHVLSDAESRLVLDGRACRGDSASLARVRVRATQVLSSSGGASAAATASQSANASVVTPVTPAANGGNVLNGCLLAGTEYNCQGVDLSQADLSGLRLAYSDFSFATLEGANLEGTRLGHVNMNLTVLDGANMQQAQFGSASLTSASLVGTDLTGSAAPYANLANAKFESARLQGANLVGANLAATSFESTGCDSGTRFPVAFPKRCVNGVITPP